jgi:ABC-type bacteriocin/lantibiotic exporter with double-glycine peptidase domain
MANISSSQIKEAKQLVKQLIYPERRFIHLAIVYGLAISLLTLAVPIAVQTLINTVVNIASVSAVITLALLLFATLAISGLLSALRTYVMEKYERHIYARLTAEISIRTLMADHNYFAGRRNVDVPNRYFDITIFQKNIPPLVIDGFALVLQLIVGFTLVSFYHPMFMAFCVLVVFCLYLIWVVWSRQAIGSALEISHSKYHTAKWLGDIATAHSFFKSGAHIDFARDKTEANTKSYVRAHEKHFKYTFSQYIALILLYAIASSSLLGLGGYLVVQGQLSIGQLVAAELILTAIFFGLSQSSSYLKLYYQLCGAADELGIVFNMPLNKEMTKPKEYKPKSSRLIFEDAEFRNEKFVYSLDFAIESGAKVFVTTEQSWMKRSFITLFHSYNSPTKGRISLGQYDLTEYKKLQLNNPPVSIINRSPIVECSIKEFMTLSAPDASFSDIQDAANQVGIASTITRLPHGWDTDLSVLGAPLQPTHFVLLKIAAAILYRPKVLIFTQNIDNLSPNERQKLLSVLEKQPFTVLYFTNEPNAEAFDYCLNLDRFRSDV